MRSWTLKKLDIGILPSDGVSICVKRSSSEGPFGFLLGVFFLVWTSLILPRHRCARKDKDREKDKAGGFGSALSPSLSLWEVLGVPLLFFLVEPFLLTVKGTPKGDCPRFGWSLLERQSLPILASCCPYQSMATGATAGSCLFALFMGAGCNPSKGCLFVTRSRSLVSSSNVRVPQLAVNKEQISMPGGLQSREAKCLLSCPPGEEEEPLQRKAREEAEQAKTIEQVQHKVTLGSAFLRLGSPKETKRTTIYIYIYIGGEGSPKKTHTPTWG